HRAGLGPPLAAAISSQPAYTLGEMCRRLGVKAGANKAASVRAIVECLTDPEQVRGLLRKAPAGAAKIAEQAARGAQVAVRAGAYGLDDRSPAGWLAGRGFLAVADWSRLVMPREVALALRGGHVLEQFSPDVPAVPVTQAEAATVDAVGAEHALRAVSDIGTLLEEWAAQPAKLLKDGGVGVRDVRRAAKATEHTERDIARLIDIAAAAGLVWVDPQADAALPTEAFDEWARLEAPFRWARLVSAWLAADFHPSLAGAISAKDKPIPPLLPRGLHEEAVAQRRTVLEILAELPPGTAAARTAVTARAGWAVPHLWEGGPATAAMLTDWALDECELLGLSACGSLTTAGRLVAAGDLAGATAALAERAPRTVDEFVLQADLTALAAGALAPDVAQDLELMADVESRGAATVYRFSEASLRRAFDAGRSADEVAAFLARHAARGVPQALAYLVADIGRRHGQARVGPARSYVRSDDVALVSELARARATSKLRFRCLAPTVLVSAAEPAAVLIALRSAGYLPTEEDAAGGLVVSRPPTRRAPNRPAPRPSLRPPRKAPTVDVAAVVAALRNGPAKPPSKAPAKPAPGKPVPAPPAAPLPSSLFDEATRPSEIAKQRGDIRDLLEQAWIEEWAVRVSYTNGKGVADQLNVLVLDVLDTKLLVEALPTYHRRTLNLNRVHWARVLTEAEEDQFL
ncbi:MAG: helicase-associated domain-containing protein, partial [Actinomycetota bacterium]|nr:helicase-associated domain-containing protein [Actinomycetota bacterium]